MARPGRRQGDAAGEAAEGVVAKVAKSAFKKSDGAAGRSAGRRGTGSLGDRLRAARTHTDGNLPLADGPPNGMLVKRDANGNPTNYAYYDANGEMTQRVDLTGRAHGPVPTPHTSTYTTHVSPDGKHRRVQEDRGSTREATPDEIP